MKVHEAVTQVMQDVRAVGKDGYNQQQRFNFRGVDATVNALSPAMRTHGLTVHPSDIISCGYEEFESKSGTRGVTCRLVVKFTFTGPEGDSFDSIVAAEANDYGDKATPKAMSVAFRTCLLQTFALPTDEKDPDEDTYDRSPKGQPKDYMALADQAQTAAQVKALWDEAKAAGAPDVYLAQLEAKGREKPS